MKFKNWSSAKNLSRDAVNRVSNTNTKNQFTLKEFIRQIDLNKPKLKKIEALLHGNFQSLIHGTGFDFNEIREYRMGDDLRHISWSATARTGGLQTKEYFAEKEVRAYFLVDISNSMFCGNKLDLFIQLIGFLLNLSCTFSEKIGGVLFNDEIKFHFPQAESYSQANIIFQTFINYCNNIHRNITIYPTITNIRKALEFTKKYFCKKGLIFIISDFINLSNWEKLIFESSQNQNIYSFQIYDPIDYYLPKSGYITILDSETKQKCTVNTDNKIIQETYHGFMKQKQEKLNSFLKSIGVNHFVIDKTDFK